MRQRHLLVRRIGQAITECQTNYPQGTSSCPAITGPTIILKRNLRIYYELNVLASTCISLFDFYSNLPSLTAKSIKIKIEIYSLFKENSHGYKKISKLQKTKSN